MDKKCPGYLVYRNLLHKKLALKGIIYANCFAELLVETEAQSGGIDEDYFELYSNSWKK